VEVDACQRWRERRETYRPAGEPIDPRRYGVEVALEGEAKPFCRRHHYSGSWPATRLAVGLYRARRWITPELVGVAAFSVPMQPAAIPRWTGQPADAGVELGRLVLLDEVEANGESFFIARALRLLAQELPEVRAVLSYSDPMRRTTDEGHIVMPGHVGGVYQALSARHVGRSASRFLLMDRWGRVVSERALSKIRLEERGHAYAYQQLLRAGAPPRRPFEDGAVYVARALAEGPFRRVKHPGNLAYILGVGGPAQRRQVLAGAPEGLPYPKFLTAPPDHLAA